MNRPKLLATVAVTSALTLVVGIPAAYAASDFGTTWNESTLAAEVATEQYIESVAFGNDTFVAVNPEGQFDDGQTFWADATTFPEETWNQVVGEIGGNDVAFGNGNFVTINYDALPRYSADNGRSWSESSVSGDVEGWFGVNKTVAFGNGKYVALGDDDDWAPGWSLVSADNGVSWQASTPASLADFLVSDLAFSGEKFVAVGRAEVPDPENPEEDTILVPAIRFSSDGITWSDVEISDADFPGIQDFSGVTSDRNGKLIALASGYTDDAVMYVATSTDHGQTWLKAAAIEGQQPLAAGYGEGVWFAALSGGGMLRSTDFGSTWSAPDFPADQEVYGFAYGSGIFASAGYSNDEPTASPIWYTGNYAGGQDDNGGSGGKLANTGSTQSLMLSGALGLLSVGAVAGVIAARSRRTRH